MKKVICLLLCLLLPVSALAAPVREMRESVLSESELYTLRGWLDPIVREAMPVDYGDNAYVGAQVYSCVEDGGCYVLECDVYLEEEGDSLPVYAPEEALSWLCDATVVIRREGSGYALVSCEVGDYYAAQAAYPVETAAYSLNLPEIFTPAQAADTYEYRDERGAVVATLRYQREDAAGMTLAGYAAALLDGEGMEVTLNEDIGQLTACDSGIYIAVTAGDGVFDVLTLTYPPEREAEFSLYGEFMRNSFVVAGQSNG